MSNNGEKMDVMDIMNWKFYEPISTNKISAHKAIIKAICANGKEMDPEMKVRLKEHASLSSEAAELVGMIDLIPVKTVEKEIARGVHM